MPYIKPEDRSLLDAALAKLLDQGICCPGDLNYVLTRIVAEYLASGNFDYAALNEVIGVLECCKLELYRRVLIPYENKKRDENGDVY